MSRLFQKLNYVLIRKHTPFRLWFYCVLSSVWFHCVFILKWFHCVLSSVWFHCVLSYVWFTVYLVCVIHCVFSSVWFHCVLSYVWFTVYLFCVISLCIYSCLCKIHEEGGGGPSAPDSRGWPPMLVSAWFPPSELLLQGKETKGKVQVNVILRTKKISRGKYPCIYRKYLVKGSNLV